MREIHISDIVKAVKKLCIDANYYLPEDVKEEIKKYAEEENWPMAKDILYKILKNVDICNNENVPMCQDTGMACVFIEIGQDVHVVGGSIEML